MFCQSTDHSLKDCVEFHCQLDEDDKSDIQVVPTPISDSTPSTSGYVSMSPSCFQGNDVEALTRVVADLCPDMVASLTLVHISSYMDPILCEKSVLDFYLSVTPLSLVHITTFVSDGYEPPFLWRIWCAHSPLLHDLHKIVEIMGLTVVHAIGAPDWRAQSHYAHTPATGAVTPSGGRPPLHPRSPSTAAKHRPTARDLILQPRNAARTTRLAWPPRSS
ncbi:hypothetical protein KSP39_PZI004924 [Platanthera zijinensis]|uniref:Uncharacterized protein n=1 Tax=Platanthera zijinensis TaxID=2320716 RepID=A0AAP0BU20_9ASPA